MPASLWLLLSVTVIASANSPVPMVRKTGGGALIDTDEIETSNSGDSKRGHGNVRGHGRSHGDGNAGLGGAANLKLYSTGSSIIEKIEAMKSNGCQVPISTEWMQDSEPNSDGKLFIVRLGNAKASKSMLVVANEHARELITGETALSLVQKACDKQPIGSSSLVEGVQASTAVQIANHLQNVRYTIVPVVNMAGRALVETGADPCQRMTTEAEGNVDLNRNMDVDWGKGAKQNWGTKPFSTYQARILRDLAAKEQPTAFVDLHSGARSLMTSWGFRPHTDPDYAAQQKSLAGVKANHCPDCEVGSNRVVIGYPNPGETIDHMYSKQNIKYTSLWEIYKGPGECVQYFNPPDKELHENANNWAEALITHGSYIEKHVDASERSRPPESGEDSLMEDEAIHDDGVLAASGALMEREQSHLPDAEHMIT